MPISQTQNDTEACHDDANLGFWNTITILTYFDVKQGKLYTK